MLQGDLFERLSLDQSLRRVFAVYTSGFLVFTKIAAFVVGANTLLWSLFALPLLLSANNISSDDVKDPLFPATNSGAFSFLTSMNVLLSMVVGAVGAGSTVRAVADLYTSRQPDWVECLKVGVNKAPALMLAALLVALGTVLGYMLFIVPGVYLSVAWFVYGPAIVLENHGPCKSLGRSRELVSGEWCYVFCTFLTVFFIMVVLQTLWTTVLLGGADFGLTVFSVMGSIVAQVPNLLVVPIFAIMQAVMYINLRIEKEGLNANLLLRGMGESTGASTDYRQVILEDEESPKTDLVSSDSAV